MCWVACASDSNDCTLQTYYVQVTSTARHATAYVIVFFALFFYTAGMQTPCSGHRKLPDSARPLRCAMAALQASSIISSPKTPKTKRLQACKAPGRRLHDPTWPRAAIGSSSRRCLTSSLEIDGRRQETGYTDITTSPGPSIQKSS